jgi:hypothetical protein
VITPSSCIIGNCLFSITECSSGIIRVYTSTCSGAPNRQIIFSGFIFNLNPSSAGAYYLKAFCDDGTTLSACHAISVQSPTPTTIPTTTTLKATCPFECCLNEPLYRDKDCAEDEFCEDNECIPLVEPTEGPDYTFYIIAIFVVAIILVVLYLVVFRKKPARKTYAELYEKWRRRY